MTRRRSATETRRYGRGETPRLMGNVEEGNAFLGRLRGAHGVIHGDTPSTS